MEIHVLKPGLQTTVQDIGRIGSQHFGVPIGGAMDKQSMKVANWLVGNPLTTPVLEMTFIGPTLRFTTNCQAAIAGANLTPELNGMPTNMFETLEISAGSELTFRKRVSGCRAYLAVAGNWKVKKWLDSYSALTFIEERIEKGRSIEVVPSKPIEKRQLAIQFRPDIDGTGSIRVIPGPEYRAFSASFVESFFKTEFKISPDSNRMGYRLEGSLPTEGLQSDIISSGTVPGVVQILPSGKPVVLLADAQTTGGYARFCNVIYSDLDLLGQKKIGDVVRFRPIDLRAADEIQKQRAALEIEMFQLSVEG